MGIEERFDISLIGVLALREKQIQQNDRPIIAVHKLFGRRSGPCFAASLIKRLGRLMSKTGVLYRTRRFTVMPL
jgi:putative DNA methylase